MSKLTLSWPDRFALINHYKPTDAQACAAFDMTQDQLDTARTLAQVGTFKASTTLDVAKYSHVFTADPAAQTTVVSAPSKTHTKGSKGSSATVHTKPESASKKAKVPQKRGRKGDKIAVALMAVPRQQVPVDDFIKEYGVSLAVLRQSKRFTEKLSAEQRKAIGQIKVRQDKTTKTLMIWSEEV